MNQPPQPGRPSPPPQPAQAGPPPQPAQPGPPPQPAAPVPYGTPEIPRVAVRGEATLEVDPEIARLTITVSARGADRRAALEDLTRRNNQVLELVKSYGEAVEKLETGAFSVAPEINPKSRHERVRAYHGRVHLTATLTDFTALGELTTRLADLELTRVDGPWWGLRPDSPAYGRARQRAVRAAVRRAREYAGALDARLVALIELADLEAEEGPFQPVAVAAPRARSGYGGPGDRDAVAALDLEPQRQTVYAHVNARFTMTPPEL
ncbi:SIMPL domain-containing protein [Streptomyces sp. 110]|uniref:SIMPL domain-containing protein n=1 Tax=Streptomyces endocoffeicus TaxID=2898945 RepID=A0ABS1PT49_9ACTN|nr:SIMPL domain-containing protein [Streptomyces endocoffeicus]MBL1115608.1 SIMPL domain-containing protein [Streptomyces endocoffeicus]